MNTRLFEQLHAEGLVSDSSFEKIKKDSDKKLISLHWDIKILLYLGVLLLSGGLGILIYKNIDSIGHQAILVFIALICASAFFYCINTKLPFATSKVESPNVYFDYVLLLACLTFMSFIAYLQFQYNVFGTRYGLATLIPMLVLFFSAYYFDHLGILSLAITNLAAWIGITVTPSQLLKANDFNSSTIIYTALFLGAFLIALAVISKMKAFKPHFEFTYSNFGTHLLFISCLAAMFHFDVLYLLWFLLLIALAYFFYTRSILNKSFYFLVITTLYTYIGMGYVVIQLLDSMRNFGMTSIYLGLMYFIASGIGLVFFLISSNRKIKAA
ncbi:DUF2157 domain-containing protein [Lacibacter sediminis]|uniref:DUF2157 domain-containing protein n=1 Tax=Lacibacter sediminis TaxID=2760713 RepID=A0A7G5XE68_9BACT|nr:DUF2157 domain-containing protein [Lacibacter sediminis]QNA43771.1 DUF2157 domain-containing protein [Lacibacter sediminis]